MWGVEPTPLAGQRMRATTADCPDREGVRGGVQGYPAHKTPPRPEDHHRALDIVLLWGPRWVRFLMGEVPLYGPTREVRCEACVCLTPLPRIQSR